VIIVFVVNRKVPRDVYRSIATGRQHCKEPSFV